MALKDAINREIAVGDYVFFKQNVYRILKVNAVLLTATKATRSTKNIIDPSRCVILNPDDVTYWILSKNEK